MAKKGLATSPWMIGLIEKAARSNRFCTSGDLPGGDPGLSVEGVGPVQLPLMPKQVKQLIAVGHVAPFGKGTQTLVDTKVRNTIEWDASQVQLSEAWNTTIAELVGKVAADLGLEAVQFEASLHKLLLYERGGHFQPHRDSEKKSGMVASLIVMLPNEFSGGELVVRHGEQRQSFAFDAARKCRSPSYVAFYADCEHEVKRVERGRRICLAYNLALKKSPKKGRTEKASSEADVLARSIEQYVARQPMDPLVFAFEHLYTQKGLKQFLLKAADRQLADLVSAASGQAGCRAYLAQIKWHVVKDAYNGEWGYERWSYGEQVKGKIEVGETIDEDLQGTEWRELNGKRQPFGVIGLAAASIVSKTPLEDWKPTSEEYEGYTGNAGNTLDRWYHRSAIVVWRGDQHFDILARADHQASVALFESMKDKLAKVPKSRYDAAHQDCERLAGAILRQWPSRSLWRYSYGNGKDDRPWLKGFIDSVFEFGDAALVHEVLAVMIDRDQVTGLETFLSLAAKKFGLESLEDELARLLASSAHHRNGLLAPRELEWFARLAREIRHGPGRDSLKRLAPLAARRFIEGYAANKSEFGVDVQTSCSCLQSLLQALTVLECADEIATVIKAVEAVPKRYRLHAEQTDCLVKLIGWCKRKKLAVPGASLAWLARVRAELERRTGARPAAASNWARPAVMKCHCPYCTTLNQFLSNPELETTRIGAAEQQRNHIQDEIRRNQADLTSKLEKVGSPYRLVFLKSTGSYERALKQFKADVSALKRLDRLSS